MFVIRKAKLHHDELNVDNNWEYSAAELQKCKKTQHKDREAAEKFMDEFGKILLITN